MFYAFIVQFKNNNVFLPVQKFNYMKFLFTIEKFV